MVKSQYYKLLLENVKHDINDFSKFCKQKCVLDFAFQFLDNSNVL